MIPQLDSDVIIVGAGPVGLTTALLLQQNGHKVKIIERHATLFPMPRAVGIFHQAARVYNSIGLFEVMQEREAILNADHLTDYAYWMSSDDEVIAKHRFFFPTSKSGLKHSFPIHQPTLEKVLESACLDRGIQIHRSAEVADVTDHGSYVEIKYGKFVLSEEGQHPATETMTAAFVLGCDGAKSVVRTSAGINLHEHLPPMSRWLVMDVVPKDIEQSRSWKDTTVGRHYADYRRPHTSVPSALKRRRWEFMLLPGETDAEAVEEGFMWTLLAEFGPTPANAVIERRTVYSIAGAWAEEFAKGRIALAGDAAHQAPQFLGQGLNSGLRDAVTVAWRIDFALKHAEDGNWEKALADFSTEQRGASEVFVRATKAAEAMLTILDPNIAAARDAGIKAGGIPPELNLERVASPGTHLRDSSVTYEEDLEPGSLFIQGEIQTPDGAKSGLFDNVVGTGWFLYTKSAHAIEDILSETTRQRFSSLLEGRLVHFAEGGYKDVNGDYGKWFAKNGVEAVLVRPDFYIYGTVKTAEQVEQLTKTAVDYLARK